MSAFPEELPSWVQISLDAANRDKESWKEIARNERIRRDRAEARVKELEACVSQINEIQDDIRKALYQAWEEGYLFCATGKISLIGSSNPNSKNASKPTGCPPPKFDNKDEESILAAALRCGIRHNEASLKAKGTHRSCGLPYRYGKGKYGSCSTPCTPN